MKSLLHSSNLQIRKMYLLSSFVFLTMPYSRVQKGLALESVDRWPYWENTSSNMNLQLDHFCPILEVDTSVSDFNQSKSFT